MRKRTTVACIALLATGLWACDDKNNETDAGHDGGQVTTDGGPVGDSGPVADAGADSGTPDAGPPAPTKFNVRLANMLAGLAPADPTDTNDHGAVEICVDTVFGPPTQLTAAPNRPLPYPGVSPYLPAPLTAGIDYTVTVYDATAFPSTGCPESTTTDPTALLQTTISAADVTAGHFYTATLSGWTVGACTNLHIDPCPLPQLGIHEDDYAAPASGKVRIRVADGVTHASGPVDVCVVDLTDSTATIPLATGISAREVSTPIEMDPIAGSGTTVIRVSEAADTPCTGDAVGLPPAPTGFAGAVPTPAQLQAADTHIPATYDADTNVWLFVFPVGGGPNPPHTDPLAIPWVDTVDPSTLL